ncbi:MAG: putative FAD-linked sulfhydryl oxidase [Edafosvirus sp.]|uniref:Sulfhydryl oxidase n=1 Tax=Edafosvirus sp. TaxID=2487765 RepID=A0A3G4ZVP2_9VIRU|nr:MAG: putative FAD-linked sulfhydryl oxidase [Edafosvirus sp.]
MINIDPKLWGYHTWNFMHYITLSYSENPTEEEMNDIKNFFLLIPKVLPCEKCRKNFILNLQKYPLTPQILQSKHQLILWLINMHNEVNIELGKPLITYDDVISMIPLNNTTDEKGNGTTICIILILLILVIIGLLLYIKFK